MDTYQIGTRPVFTVSFKLNDALTTPSNGTWKLEAPDGTETVFNWTDPAITIVSAGVVQFQPPAVFDQSGIWTIRAEALAPFSDAHEEKFEVLPSAFTSQAAGRYCSREDLLVGDLTVSPAQLDRFIAQAADDIDAELGVEYIVPILFTNTPPHVRLMLKKINTLLATGRFIMAQAVGGEQDGTHAYGYSLVKEAQGMILAIKNGQVELPGVTRRIVQVQGNAPAIFNHDKHSAVDAFYGLTGNSTDFWRAG